MTKFPDRLSYALEFRHMKQTELARITGINKSMISNYLSGRFEPRDENLTKLASALNVNKMWLDGYDADMLPYDPFNPDNQHRPPSETTANYYEHHIKDFRSSDWDYCRKEKLTREEMDIITAYRDADDKIRSAIRTLLSIPEGV